MGKESSEINYINRELDDQTSPIITLCGSTRFPDIWKEYNAKLSIAGCIVLSVGLFGHMEGMDMAGELKKSLDRLHFDKIRISDAIFVLNKDGYIGLSAWDEIFYAISHRVSIFFLEPIKRECAEELRSFLASEVDDCLCGLRGKSMDGVSSVLFLIGNNRHIKPYDTNILEECLLDFCRR